MSSSLPFSRLGLDEAVDAILQGKIIAFPTETFYGLGCDAMNADAVASVFALKLRSLVMPLPVIIGARSMLDMLAMPVEGATMALMEAFWPGPLSIVLEARPEIPDLLTADGRRVAVRYSPHPTALALCNALARPIVASSANISGRPPVAQPDLLDPELLHGLAGVLVDGPPPCGGLPSTVVDIRERPGKTVVRILRPGVIPRQAFENKGFTVIEKSG